MVCVTFETVFRSPLLLQLGIILLLRFNSVQSDVYQCSLITKYLTVINAYNPLSRLVKAR